MADEDLTLRMRVLGRAKWSTDLDKARRDQERFSDGMDHSRDHADRLSTAIDGLGPRLLGLVKPAALITAGGLGAGAMFAAAGGAVALGGALAPAAGIMATYPALGSAVGQGLGVAKLATAGLSGALGGLHDKLDPKKMKQLTPEARGLARVLQGLKPDVLSLQRAAQKGLFPGVEAGLKRASPLLAVFRKGARSTGQTLGGLAQQAGTMLGSRGWTRDLQTQVARNNVTIGRLGNTGLFLAGALRHVMLAAGPLVNWMTRLAMRWSAGAESAAQAGRETGRLQRFFESTRWTLSRLFSIAGHVGSALWQIGKRGAPLGRDLLRAVDRNAAAMERWTKSTRGRNRLAAYFREVRPTVFEIGRLVRDVTRDFARLGTQSHMAPLLRQLRTGLLPVLFHVLSSTTSAFGPHLIDLITNLAKAFEPVAGSSGPLVLTVQALSALAKASVAIEQTVPGASTGLSVLFGLLAVQKAVQLTAIVTGFNRLRVAWATGATTLATLRGGLAAYRAVMIANTGVQNVSTAAAVRHMIVSRIAAGATRAQAAAQWILNAAMTANPIFLVVAALVAVGAAFVLAYRRVGWFRNAVNATWSWIRRHWPLLLSILTGPIGAATIYIVRHWAQIRGAATSVVRWVIGRFNALVAFFSGLPRRMARFGLHLFDSIKEGFRSAINWIISRWNNLSFSMGGTKVAGHTVIPKVTINTPDVPLLAAGGVVTGAGGWITGEAGPELNVMDRLGRVTVTPLSDAPTGSVAGHHSRRPPPPASSGPGGGERIRLPDIHTHVMLDRREIARAVHRFDDDEAARK